MKKGAVLILHIEKLIFEGKGLGKIDTVLQPEYEEFKDLVVLVSHAYPGDTIKAQAKKIKKNFIEADLQEIVTPSQFRVKERCKYYKSCGGCKQQDLQYAEQVKLKQMQVEEIFHHMGGFTTIPVEPIIASTKEFYYRNKMEYSFSDSGWVPLASFDKENPPERKPALGLHVPQGFERVVNIDECFLQSEISNKILCFTAEYFFSRGVSIYTHRTHEGYLRNLVIKQASNLPQLMVNLVTSARDEAMMKAYTEALLAEIPEVTTVVNNINTRKAMIAVGEYEFADFGPGFIEDTIGGNLFRISANAFFQTNTTQAANLYQLAVDYAGLTGSEIVYDLYCGAGTISIFMHKFVKEVYGFEVVEQAIKDAEVNKQVNNAENTRFFVADLYSSMLPMVSGNNLPLPDVLIADPPRSGMHQNTVNDILALKPGKIVYVSCNPATQVRDVQLLVAGGYRLIKVRPVDMFPHTFHIENVALLIKE
ncbi:MAG: 23S rRNA (uracil(1939)-C(5))-methyltransferase RlmD [Ignavibacteriales bacterium]|nr:23S rRNA (uracil(1939)-C(5))-methyltransferase RlmD [Ignavibacteriales bacterium]